MASKKDAPGMRMEKLINYKRPKYNNNLGRNCYLIYSRKIETNDPETGITIPHQISFVESKDNAPDGSVGATLEAVTYYEPNGRFRVEIKGKGFEFAER